MSFAALLLVFSLQSSVTGFGGDGNITFGYPDPSPNGTMCVNDFDDNRWDGADGDDLGCVEPLKFVPESVLDKTEGNIWDSDLSNQLGGPGEEDLWFGANVYRGSSSRTMNRNDRVESGDEEDNLRIFNVDESRSEENNWSYGFVENQTFGVSNFPERADFDSGAVIDPPHDFNEADMCGNGVEDDIVPIENDGQTPDDETEEDFGVEWGGNNWGNGNGYEATSMGGGLGAETPCRADYGRIYEKHDRKLVDSSARDAYGGLLTCDTDDASVTDFGCGGSDNGCSPTGITTCQTEIYDDKTDNNNDGVDDRDTWYFSEVGDTINRVDCNRPGGEPDRYADSDSCMTESEECETDEDGDESCSCENDGREYCGAGVAREWQQTDEIDCSRHDVVDGGTDSESDINGTSYDDYPEIGDNDPAATWTEFTAHSDDDWGTRDTWSGQTSNDEETGSVWCGYQDATTLDADGPNGGLDGFVVISNRGSRSSMDTGRPDPNRHTGNDIIGSYTPESDSGDVTDVWLDGSYRNAESEIERKLKAQGKMDCPGNNQICVVYIDKINHDSLEEWKERWYFDGNGDNPGDWYQADSGSPWWHEGFKVEASDQFLPSESYSVCKLANRAAGQEVVDCDYTKNGEGHSPLPEACGDQPGERMIAQEGSEIDHGTIDDYPALKQECYNYGASLKDGGSKNFYLNNYNQDWGPQLENKYGFPENAPNDYENNDYEVDGIQDYNLEDKRIGGGGSTLSGANWINYGWDTLRRGTNQTLKATLNMDDNREHTISARFDWDRNGDFEADETYEVGSCRGDNCEVGLNFTVPEDAETGISVMRVRDSSSDDSQEYGEVWTSVFFINESKEVIASPTEDACVLNGQVYPEGSLVDVSNKDFDGIEEGGDSADKEVCIGGMEYTGDSSSDGNLPYNWWSFEEDNGGVWVDIDNFQATKYIRENKPLDSQAYKENWVSNPDKNASKNTGITGVKKEYVNEKGFALEDDCILWGDSGETIECEDMDSGTGDVTPTWARFTEGAMNDDFNDGDTWFDVNLDNVHNRVQSGGNTGHPQAEPLSTRNYIVDSDSEWDNGQYSETTSNDGFLETTETFDNSDKNFELDGEPVYGKYVSETFTTTEDRFSTVTVYNEQNMGEVGGHPIVIEYAEDPGFTENVGSEKYYFNESKPRQEFSVGAESSQEYLRFKIGVTEEPVTPTVVFAVDRSGSMSSFIGGVQQNIKEFYQDLGANSKGTIVGGGYPPEDVVPGEGLTTNNEDLEYGAENIGSGTENPDWSIAQASDYDGFEERDLPEESYDFTGTNNAIVWIQSGDTYGDTYCDSLVDFEDGLGNHLVDNDFTFYSVWGNLGGCGENYDEAASNTGGKTYDIGGADWNQILEDIGGDLVGLGEDPLVDRVEVTASTPANYDGSGNTQDDEPKSLADPASSEYLEWYEDAHIDARDDEWAYTPTLEWGIANNGSAWPPSACYGAPREQGVDKKKEDAVYANSYLRSDEDVYSNGRSGGRNDGNWVNPDNTTLSVREGGLTCDLTGKDWGYAVRKPSVSDLDCLGGDCDADGDPTSEGLEGVDNSIPHEVALPEDSLTFDNYSDPDGHEQDDLKQWPDACGDDRNEYLIREHAAEVEGEYDPLLSGRDNIYVCADRPTDCALDGEVYSEGDLADVGAATEETGVESEDEEVCLDVVEELPGGEWYDVDNESLRSHLIKSGTPDNPEEYVRTGQIEPASPGHPYWHNSSTGDSVRDEALREARDSPYSPLGPTNFYGKNIDFWRGYALEDDCDSDVMSGCDDKGVEETRGTNEDPSSDLIYSHFRESKDGTAIRSDDHSKEDTWVVRMYVDGSSDHGSDTGQVGENTPGVSFDSTNWGPNGGWPTASLNDSAINESEDSWAVASEPWDAVGPTGAVYDVGSCYGKNPPEHSEGWVLKNETVMANSYVNRTEVNVDGGDEGNWVDPDTTFKSVSNGSLSCDLNSTDWGIGYNTGTGTDLETIAGASRDYGYNVTDRHAVTGPISFDMGQNPLGENQNDLQQYPDACGDDQQEYLVREQRTYRGNEIKPNLTHRENIYVCADRIADCAYNGYVFSEGQTVDLSDFSPSHTDPEVGENISDEEICLDLNKTTPGGEWYDKDQNLTVKDRILGLENTFTDDEEPGFGNCNYDLSGKVIGAPGYGDIVIDGETMSLDSSNRFSGTGIQIACGSTKLIKYQRTGHVQAKKRVKLPNSGASLTDIVLSNALMYQPTEVWDGIVKFRDHDYDRNPGTDWVRQGEKFEREEVSFFNRTHDRFNETGSRILDSTYTASNWGSGEPNDKDGTEDGEEDCAAIRSSGDWNDQTCTDLIKGVCEFQDGSYATTAPRTWNVANQTCYSKGGHLAVVNSASENNMISSTYGHGWIGYSQEGSASGTADSWNWVNSSGTYQPEAYATEDDCGPLLRKSDTAPCGDVGAGEQDEEWFSAGNYSFGGVQP